MTRLHNVDNIRQKDIIFDMVGIDSAPLALLSTTQREERLEKRNGSLEYVSAGGRGGGGSNFSD
jgi:hypothetical protein